LGAEVDFPSLAAMSSNILHSAWKYNDGTAQNCYGPPTAMFGFEDSQVNWHNDFNFTRTQSLPYLECGRGRTSLFDGCCVEFLSSKVSKYDAVYSTQRNAYMKDSIGKKYCHMSNPDGLILGKYKDIFILDEGKPSPVCIEDRLKCTNGTLYVYRQFGGSCAGTQPISFKLSDTPSSWTIDEIPISVHVQTITSGTEATKWTAYYPTYLARPIPENQAYYISSTFVVLSITGTLSVGGFYSYRLGLV
jgi:hypothetical protein